jgi:hypothetical protein
VKAPRLLTVVTPDRKYTVSLSAVTLSVKADFLISNFNAFVKFEYHEQ